MFALFIFVLFRVTLAIIISITILLFLPLNPNYSYTTWTETKIIVGIIGLIFVYYTLCQNLIKLIFDDFVFSIFSLLLAEIQN